jgi:hypothetical protein
LKNHITEPYDRRENIEFETEEEENAEEKGPYSLKSEVEKAAKLMRDENATGNYDVVGYVLRLLEKMASD